MRAPDHRAVSAADPETLAGGQILSPDEFAEFKKIAYQKGFQYVEAGPLVRSSYHAAEAHEWVKGQGASSKE